MDIIYTIFVLLLTVNSFKHWPIYFYIIYCAYYEPNLLKKVRKIINKLKRDVLILRLTNQRSGYSTLVTVLNASKWVFGRGIRTLEFELPTLV